MERHEFVLILYDNSGDEVVVLEIRTTRKEDLGKILELYHEARRFMVAGGNPTQWGDDYPPEEMIEQDIVSGKSYVCEHQECVVGVFYFAIEEEPSYVEIQEGQWLNETPYGVVHRIAAPTQVKGVASYCINWCYEKSGKNLRIDTHRNNIPMKQLLQKLEFQMCGIIYVEDGTDRIAYQKS